MTKIKKFWKDHKKEICIIGGLAVAAIAVTGIIVLKQKESIQDLEKGFNTIKWKPNPNGSVLNLERVKELLDANKDNASQFAIFREGPNPDEYIAIKMDNLFVS